MMCPVLCITDMVITVGYELTFYSDVVKVVNIVSNVLAICVGFWLFANSTVCATTRMILMAAF